VTIDPTGSDLFTLDPSNNRILAYTIGSNGALTPVSGSPFATGLNPRSQALDPTGHFLYVANTTANTVSVFSNTAGSLAPISGSPFSIPVPGQSYTISSVTLDPTGRFAYIPENVGPDIFTYSIGSGGGLTLVTRSAIQAGSFGFMPLLPPFVYVQNENTNTPTTTSAFTTDSNGALLPVPGSPFLTGLDDFIPAVDPTGKFVYIVNYADNKVSVYSIGSTGSLTKRSTVATGNRPSSVGVDPTGRYIYVVNSIDGTVSAILSGQPEL
jgi:6-phosphogluconolactonase